MVARTKSSKSKQSDQALIKGLRKIKSQIPVAGLSGDPRKWTKRRQLQIFRKYKDVAEGKAFGVKLSKQMAARYEDARLKDVKILGGNIAVVPAQPGYTKAEVIKGEPIFGGMIRLVKPLAAGEIERIILPYHITKITEFMREVRANPQWDKLKKEAERFRFGFGDGSVDGTNWNGSRWGRLADIADMLETYEQIKNQPNSARDRSLMSCLQIVRTRGITDIDARYAEQQDIKRQRSIEAKKKSNKRRYAKLKKERGG